jgi:hypothetical protein
VAGGERPAPSPVHADMAAIAVAMTGKAITDSEFRHRITNGVLLPDVRR